MALVAGPGPVGDLVARQAGAGEQLVGQQVLVGLVVVVGMAGRVERQRRAGLDGEGVGAHVRRLERRARARAWPAQSASDSPAPP